MPWTEWIYPEVPTWERLWSTRDSTSSFVHEDDPNLYIMMDEAQERGLRHWIGINFISNNSRWSGIWSTKSGGSSTWNAESANDSWLYFAGRTSGGTGVPSGMESDAWVRKRDVRGTSIGIHQWSHTFFRNLNSRAYIVDVEALRSWDLPWVSGSPSGYSQMNTMKYMADRHNPGGPEPTWHPHGLGFIDWDDSVSNDIQVEYNLQGKDADPIFPGNNGIGWNPPSPTTGSTIPGFKLAVSRGQLFSGTEFAGSWVDESVAQTVADYTTGNHPHPGPHFWNIPLIQADDERVHIIHTPDDVYRDWWECWEPWTGASDPEFVYRNTGLMRLNSRHILRYTMTVRPFRYWYNIFRWPIFYMPLDAPFFTSETRPLQGTINGIAKPGYTERMDDGWWTFEQGQAMSLDHVYWGPFWPETILRWAYESTEDDYVVDGDNPEEWVAQTEWPYEEDTPDDSAYGMFIYGGKLYYLVRSFYSVEYDDWFWDVIVEYGTGGQITRWFSLAGNFGDVPFVWPYDEVQFHWRSDSQTYLHDGIIYILTYQSGDTSQDWTMRVEMFSISDWDYIGSLVSFVDWNSGGDFEPEQIAVGDDGVWLFGWTDHPDHETWTTETLRRYTHDGNLNFSVYNNYLIEDIEGWWIPWRTQGMLRHENYLYIRSDDFRTFLDDDGHRLDVGDYIFRIDVNNPPTVSPDLSLWPHTWGYQEAQDEDGNWHWWGHWGWDEEMYMPVAFTGIPDLRIVGRTGNQRIEDGHDTAQRTPKLGPGSYY